MRCSTPERRSPSQVHLRSIPRSCALSLSMFRRYAVCNGLPFAPARYTVIVPVLRRPVRADRATLLEVAKRYPNYTMAQRLAVLREMQSELHPRFRDLSLSEIAARLLKFAASELV